ncbi:MAG TPA: hypothetical protein VK154_18680 [Chitinophagales bacterium]|nr:hypothetical protein [Chitinophagales bacterium]
MKLLLPAFIVVLFISAPVESKVNIKGLWVYNNSELWNSEYVGVYVKANSFKKDEAGMAFRANGKMVKRQNESWCGTPPVIYKNYPGKWEAVDNSTIAIEYKFWGKGWQKARLRVVSLNDDTLKIVHLSVSR